MTKDEIQVPISKFNDMGEYISCAEISENGRALKSFQIEGKKYVITGGVGTGTGSGGWGCLWAIEMIPIEMYSQPIEPMKYHDHLYLVINDKRERGYNGVNILCEGRQVVLMGETIRFIPKKE